MSKPPFLPGQLRLILAITLVYLAAWFAYFGQIPPGQYPTVESMKTLSDALSIAEGTNDGLESASLYTKILSVAALHSDDLTSLTRAARALNLIGLTFAVGLCAAAAGHYWKKNRAVWATGLLLGLNPVLIFWAAEPSPCIFATLCISLVVWRTHPWLRAPKLRNTLLISIGLTLAAAFNTTLIAFPIAWIILCLFYPRRERIFHTSLALIAPIGLGLLLSVSNLTLQTPLTIEFTSVALESYQALAGTEPSDARDFSLYWRLHFLLLFNPIHWGLLFLLMIGGAYCRLKDGYSGRSIRLAGATLLSFALSYALIDNSGSQSRAAMLPILAFFSAGSIAYLPKIWRHAGLRTRRKIRAGAAAAICFSYAGIVLGQPASTFWEDDYVHLANANIYLGNSDLATTWAEKALELNPERSDMHEIIILAEFQKWAFSNKPRSLPTETTREYLEEASALVDSPIVQTIRGIYLYKLRETDTAIDLWTQHADDNSLAVICLYWTGNLSEQLRPKDFDPRSDTYDALLIDVEKTDRNDLEYTKLERKIDNMLSFAY